MYQELEVKATSTGKKKFSYDMKILWNLVLVILRKSGCTWMERKLGIIICKDRKLSAFMQKHGLTYSGQMKSNKTSPHYPGGRGEVRIIRITFIGENARRTHLRKELKTQRNAHLIKSKGGLIHKK